MKCRVGAEVDTKKQKKLLEDVQKGNIEKVKEKTTNKTELNFTIEGGNRCAHSRYTFNFCSDE